MPMAVRQSIRFMRLTSQREPRNSTALSPSTLRYQELAMVAQVETLITTHSYTCSALVLLLTTAKFSFQWDLQEILEIFTVGCLPIAQAILALHRLFGLPLLTAVEQGFGRQELHQPLTRTTTFT